MQAPLRVSKHGIVPPAALDDPAFEPAQMVCTTPFLLSSSQLTDSAAAANIEGQVYKNGVSSFGIAHSPSFSFGWHHPGSSL